MKLLVLSLMAIFTTTSAMACSCALSTAQQMLDRAEVLVYASPSRDSQIAPLPNSLNDPYVMMTNFRVIKKFKGTEKESLRIITSLPVISCGMSFKAGGAPLIISAYKDRVSGLLTTSACSLKYVSSESSFDFLVELANLSKKH